MLFFSPRHQSKSSIPPPTMSTRATSLMEGESKRVVFERATSPVKRTNGRFKHNSVYVRSSWSWSNEMLKIEVVLFWSHVRRMLNSGIESINYDLKASCFKNSFKEQPIFLIESCSNKYRVTFCSLAVSITTLYSWREVSLFHRHTRARPTSFSSFTECVSDVCYPWE